MGVVTALPNVAAYDVSTIQVHVPPVQLARHVNDEEALREFFRSRRLEGIQIDAELAEEWIVHEGPDARAIPLRPFLQNLHAMHAEYAAKERLRTLVEVRIPELSNEESDRLLEPFDRVRDRLDIRFVGYAPAVMNTLLHGAMSREDPYRCQLYVQEDDLAGHVQWSKRDRLGLPEELGYHLRLHAFPPSRRPTFEAAVRTGRLISTTGWNPLYDGWRNVDLSGVWNVRRR